MSYAENLRTVEEFTEKGWRETPHSRRVEEIISVYNETSRLTDRYTYFYDQKGFYMWAKDKADDSPKKMYVKDIIGRRSYPSSAEGEVFDKLEDWFPKNTEGQAIWASLPYPGRDPDPKVIFHQIAYTAGDMQKVLKNSAVGFKATNEAVLDILHEFFPETIDFTNPEAFRPHLIAVDGNFDLSGLLTRIKEIDPEALVANGKFEEKQLNERAAYISNLIGSGAAARFVAVEARRLGLVGQHPISCLKGLSFSELIAGSQSIQDQYGSLEFKCPTCSATNRRQSGVLISNCQHCGANVRC